ncbi:hypothetical protein [Fuerstiella marisgermanici]|uniref:Peptidase S54 rhomboid domain-containing protein n=1 Tax=Fuerstiella marisgermanici TaxID=1891926 RepID=A0A1P8WMD4_9PLAN|nr:hypothetical protein [Fuerstiella marisgermanici]APZ95223.1 hypothetical protein Fuma_04879 [Fuerstiella marisgermanici]
MISRLERKFGRFAVPNLTLILIVGQVAAFVLGQRDPQIWERLVLVPSKVLDGEVYRLVSFLILPPGTALLWAFFFWYLFYLMGTALEQYWGTFRFNVFLLIGYVATVAASFISPEAPAGNGFLQGSVFLAFAYLNPNFELMLAFILPVKIKWFALLTWAFFVLTIVFGDWPERLSAMAGTLNFFLFFGSEIFGRARSGQRFMASQAKRFGQKPPEFFHKCYSCGLTDADDPSMDFRYCSKCSGDLCYCSEHLRSHEHVLDSNIEDA